MSGGTVKAGYKLTEVGVIPEEWEASRLAAQIREPIRNGYSPVCPSKPTGRWMLSLSAVTHAGFDSSGVKPAPLKDPKVDENLLLEGDIVVSRSNTPDRVGLAGIYRGNPSPCAYPDLLMRVRLKNALAPEFLLSCLLAGAGRRYFSDNARGSSGSMVKIDSAILRAFPIQVPPMEEQDAIVAALSDVDALISGLDQLIAKKRDLKQAAMQQLLTGQRRLPGFERIRGFKHAEVGVIPEDWDCVLLGSKAKRGSGHTPSKKFPEYWDGSIKWISLQDSDRLDRILISETAATISPAGLVHSSAVLHPPGTVVLSRDAGVGKSAIMAETMAVSQHFIAWQCGPELNNYFIYYWLQSKKSEFERIAIGNTIKTIGLAYFKALRIPFPNTSEQSAIACTLSDMDAELAALESRRDKTRALKQGMMQELLTGRIRLL